MAGEARHNHKAADLGSSSDDNTMAQISTGLIAMNINDSESKPR